MASPARGAFALAVATPGAWRSFTLTALALGLLPRAFATAPVTALKAEARDGQVFVTWNESESPAGSTFNVYASDHPIAHISEAKLLGHHIEPHSARDWWEDPASFAGPKEKVEAADNPIPPAKPVGFLLVPGGQRLDPTGGLFVHTLPKTTPGSLYFAVTMTSPQGQEDGALVAGSNSMPTPVKASPGPLRPIWQAATPPPPAGRGKGLALWLNLHAKGGVVPKMEYLLFGDASMGWREGIPFKFSVRPTAEELVVAPTDRVWINRPHLEAGDGGMPAIWTFWYGYNSKIYDRSRMGQGIPTNYTERRNLWILDWVKSYYQPDMRRAYCSGSSMGGCGTVSFGLRHPELFAGLHANVPIVAYTYLGKGSATRFEPCCWIGRILPTLQTNEGVGFLDRMDGTRFVNQTTEDLPMLFLIHGRQDGSIPWENNPAFYRALNETHQAFAVYWDNGTHSTAGKDAPPDVKDWLRRFRTLRGDESYPAFSNTSSNRNPGDGRPEDGDIIGWMNRGMGWKEIDDQPDHYSVTLTADYPGIQYPVKTDVTLRRVQHFHPAASERLSVRGGSGAPRAMQGVERDAQGRIRILQIEIPSSEGLRIEVQKEK